MHKMMIIVIRRNIDKVSGFPDIILGDIVTGTQRIKNNLIKFIHFKVCFFLNVVSFSKRSKSQ